MKSCLCLPVVFITVAAIWDVIGCRRLHNDLHKVKYKGGERERESRLFESKARLTTFLEKVLLGTEGYLNTFNKLFCRQVMTENEKEIYFAGEKPEDTNYEVIEILQPRLREMSGPQVEAAPAPLTRVR